MPSLDETFDASRTQSFDQPVLQDGRLPPVADDAAQISERLSVIGICCFLLGVGIAFFFDSLLGTIAYTLTLGQLAYGLLRVLIATVPAKDLPWILAWVSGAPMAGRPATVRARIRTRLPQIRGGTHSMGRDTGLSDRLHRWLVVVRSVRASDDGDRL